VFNVSPKNTSLFLLDIFLVFYKGDANVDTYRLAFLFYLNSTTYCLGDLINRRLCFKYHQLSWNLDLLRPLIDTLCINNNILLLRVADDVEGVINLTGNGDVIV
jgi:hypothetical protein